MRFELSGSLTRPAPIVLNLTDETFTPQTYIDKGFTDFDVICIGGGGGSGGGIKTSNTGTQLRLFGGAGGGGGIHRVRGKLSGLPAVVPIVIGYGGAVGLDHISDPALTTDGGDGGVTSFNNLTCRASGGQGGKKVQINSSNVSSGANGGQGGIGDRTLSGGGANGGIAGVPTATGPGTPGTNGTDGTWNGVIGSGGGGGAGGVGKYGGITCNAATAGGRGAFNPGDTSVYGLGEDPTDDILESAAIDIIPGGAGGAKASPVNGLPYLYGRSWGDPITGERGAIFIRLLVI